MPLIVSACGARTALELDESRGGESGAEPNGAGGAGSNLGGRAGSNAGHGGSNVGGSSGAGTGGVAAAGTGGTTDPVACPPGTFSALGTEPCKPWTDCPLGRYVSVEGTATSDRQCTQCPRGQSTTALNALACAPNLVTDLGIGGNSSCAVFSDNTVNCWGDNEAGQLGHSGEHIGDNELPASVDPVVVTHAPGVRVMHVDSGLFSACALLSDGTVKCWGDNLEGLGGQGSKDPTRIVDPALLEPISLTTLPGVIASQIAANLHACALLSNGSVTCWGYNYAGQLGYGNSKNIGDDELPSSTGPVSITTTRGVTATQVTVGFEHSCALLSDGSVKCWGSNQFGQLGYGNTKNIGDDELPSSVGPVSVTKTPGVTVTSIQAGSNHTCALLSDGNVKCWGDNQDGKLGYGNTENIGDNELPSSVGAVRITDLAGVTVKALTTRGHHTCVLLSEGSVKCWGANLWGELGYGDTNDIGDDELPSSVGAVKITLTPGVTVEKLGTARVHTCALLSDHSVKCWGEGNLGQLGYGNKENIGDNEPPTAVGPVKLF